MQIESEPMTKQRAARQWVGELPQDLVPLKEQYAVLRVGEKLENIDPQDVVNVLNRYAQDLSIDFYSIAEIFNLSGSALNTLLKDERFKTLYQWAKKIRAAKAAQAALEAANTPYDKIMKGEQIPGLLVKAAALKANFNLKYAQTLDADLLPKGGAFNAEGDINIQINNGIKIREL